MSFHLLLCALGIHWWSVDDQHDAVCPICKARGRYLDAQRGDQAFVVQRPPT